jgi:arylformamidase
MTISWRDMDRATLDSAYGNTEAVANSAELMVQFQQRSAAFHATHEGERDVAYGSSARERFDFFPAASTDAPTFVFIHGGYWQYCAKEDFAFVAEGPLACGMNVVLAEYTLAPEASIARISDEIGRLLNALAARGLGRLVLSGHSAGGHLGAMHRGHPAVTQALLMSGLYELAPIAAGSLNDKLQLSADEIACFSPIRHVGRGAPALVSVGSEELPELVRQSREFAQACVAEGERATYLPLADTNHFSILFDLAMGDGVQLSALRTLMTG